LIAEALDLEPTTFSKLFDSISNDRLTIAKYPPPPPSDDESRFQGIGTHKDTSFLTFLLLETAHTGLEVQNKSGTWISVPPLPDTLVVNIGRQLEAITQGVCKATTHRVNYSASDFLDQNGNSLGSRYSFPFLQSLSLDVAPQDVYIEIPPHIKELVNDEDVVSDAGKITQEFYNQGLGVGIFSIKVYRNPQIAQKWYPGLREKIVSERNSIRDNFRLARAKKHNTK
jgi:isopenicillin N synthase-like dioxygenase